MKKRALVVICFTLIMGNLFAENGRKFFEFIDAIEKIEVSQRMDFMEKEFEKVKAETNFPIINKTEVTFVFLGNLKTKMAYVVGDFTDWESNPLLMRKIEGTNIFIANKEFPSNARIEYMYKRKGAAQLDLDALSGKNVSNGMGRKNSIVEMPDYNVGVENKGVEEAFKGTLEKFELKCKSVVDGSDKVRTVTVYIPNGYNNEKKYNTIYFFDGSGYLDEQHGNAKNILDYMIKNQEIDPVVGIFIDPVERESEMILAERTKFMEYMVKEFIPWVEGKYSVKTDVDSRIIAGISNGGFLVTDLIYKYPAVFKRALSGSRAPVRHDDGTTLDYNKYVETMNMSGYIFMATGEFDGFLKDSREYAEALKKNKSVKAVKFVTKYDGHNWRFWRDVLRNGLLWQKNNSIEVSGVSLESSEKIKIRTIADEKSTWIQKFNDRDKSIVDLYDKNANFIINGEFIKSSEREKYFKKLYDLDKKIISREILDTKEYDKTRLIEKGIFSTNGRKIFYVTVWEKYKKKWYIPLEMLNEITEEAVDISMIEESRRRYEILGTTKDLKGFVTNIFDENGAYFNSGEFFIGTDAIYERFKNNMAGRNEFTMSFKQEGIVPISKDFVVDYGKYQSGESNGNYFFYWKKQKNGMWKIFLDLCIF